MSEALSVAKNAAVAITCVVVAGIVILVGFEPLTVLVSTVLNSTIFPLRDMLPGTEAPGPGFLLVLDGATVVISSAVTAAGLLLLGRAARLNAWHVSAAVAVVVLGQALFDLWSGTNLGFWFSSGYWLWVASVVSVCSLAVLVQARSRSHTRAPST
ncbi:MAG: hypothetical protein FDZ70_09660 [Actinobacteria bacterium]|nr:MAG: hypothetical protein FDZ70_09660 [Actinomycetota bacterium]